MSWNELIHQYYDLTEMNNLLTMLPLFLSLLTPKCASQWLK